MPKQRDLSFDVMKGIGIILVLLGHVWSYYLPHTHQFIYTFHMPMFFIVAGYFSKGCSDRASAWQSIRHFFRRLCVPAIITQAAIVLYSAFNTIVKGTSWDATIVEALALFWADIHGPVTPWGKLGYGVIWFLLALFFAKCILLFLSRAKGWAIPVAFALALGSIGLHSVFPYSIWCISIALTALPFVTIGWWCREHRIPVWLKVLCLCCWVAAFFCSEMDMYDFKYACYPLDALGACGGTYALYLLCKLLKNSKIIGSGFAYLGTISLIVMCVHCFEMAAHLGSHVAALFHLKLSVGGLYVFRYVLTLAIAVAIDLAPKCYHRLMPQKIKS